MVRARGFASGRSRCAIVLAVASAATISFGCGGSESGDAVDANPNAADADPNAADADPGAVDADPSAPDASTTQHDVVLCGEPSGFAPDITALASGSAGEGQNSEYCGAQFPTLDLAANDPFAAIRYQAPPANMVSPFPACREAYQASMSSRPLCSEVTGSSTFLVTKAGESDPRWQPAVFAAHYSTIQAAIDAAEHCDTIIVRPGTYKEYLSIAGKDVQIFSDTWNEAGNVEDGDERVASYTAERIDLLRYYEEGVRQVVESRQTYMKPLKRTVRTILEGGGYSEGPTLGGTVDYDHSAGHPNSGCGNRRPMVDFVAGTTRNTVFDGFVVRLMPEQDHTIPGHGHTLQCRGGSPIISNNIMYNNGSTGAGVHASFVETTPLTPPCEDFPELEQQTFSNGDYRHSNVEYRPVPLLYGNISYQNNGLGLGNNHYSCGVMVGNESFWNAVPGEEAEHQSPGIGTRHGAKTCLDRNIVYENAWTGIAVRQGYLQPKDECAADPVGCNHIDERTQAVVTRNIVFANGSDEAPEDSRGAIGVDGVGLPDEPVLIRENVVFASRVSGIGVRNQYAGADRGFVLDDSYAVVVNNTAFSNDQQGITCQGSEYGTAHCTIVGNDAFWNRTAGIGFSDDADGSALHNVAACNTSSGFQTTEVSGSADIAIYNNIAWANVSAGIMDLGSLHDYNLLSANNGQAASCSDEPQGLQCKNPQVGSQSGGVVGVNELFEDPEFVAPASFDFAVSAGSPAIDSGTDISAYYSSWPAAGNPDRGSHEQ